MTIRSVRFADLDARAPRGQQPGRRSSGLGFHRGSTLSRVCPQIRLVPPAIEGVLDPASTLAAGGRAASPLRALFGSNWIGAGRPWSSQTICMRVSYLYTRTSLTMADTPMATRGFRSWAKVCPVARSQEPLRSLCARVCIAPEARASARRTD